MAPHAWSQVAVSAINRTGSFFRNQLLFSFFPCVSKRGKPQCFCCYRDSFPVFDDAVHVPPSQDRLLLGADIVSVLHCQISLSVRAQGGFGEQQLSLQQCPQPRLLVAIPLLGCSPGLFSVQLPKHWPKSLPQVRTAFVSNTSLPLGCCLSSGWELSEGSALTMTAGLHGFEDKFQICPSLQVSGNCR